MVGRAGGANSCGCLRKVSLDLNRGWVSLGTMSLLTDPQTWISLLTLTVLEIVLGIDNVIFIAILAAKLPKHEQGKARTIGLFLALFARIGLLCSIFWLMKLTQPMFEVLGHAVSGKDIVLLLGGLFCSGKASMKSTAPWRGQATNLLPAGGRN